jgi:hypothetical protein
VKDFSPKQPKGVCNRRLADRLSTKPAAALATNLETEANDRVSSSTPSHKIIRLRGFRFSQLNARARAVMYFVEELVGEG